MDPIGSTTAAATESPAPLAQPAPALTAPAPGAAPLAPDRHGLEDRSPHELRDTFSHGTRDDDPLTRFVDRLRTLAAAAPRDVPTQPLTGDPSLSSPLTSAVAAGSTRQVVFASAAIASTPVATTAAAPAPTPVTAPVAAGSTGDPTSGDPHTA
jgi:hypothetical protein